MTDTKDLTVFDLNNLATNVARTRNYPTAISIMKRAVTIDGKQSVLWATLGLLLLQAGRYDEADDALHRACMMDPGEWTYWHNQGLVQLALGRFNDALYCMDKALANNSVEPTILWDQALVLLSIGDWKAGFKAYESRIQWAPTRFPRFQMPFWRGEDLAGKHLLIVNEQGDGDIFMFSRYITWVSNQYGAAIKPGSGVRISVTLPPNMAALFKNHPNIDEIITVGEALPAADYGIYIGSLPAIHGTDLSNNKPPPDCGHFATRAKQIRIPIAEVVPGARKVGIVWAGNPMHPRDHERSVSLDRFLPMIERTDISLYSFQFGKRAGDIREKHATPFIADLSQLMSDWTVTAGMLAQMDIVISVDSAIAHLAPLCGVETWALLSYIPDWRWLNTKDFTSPWYPSVRLYRQEKPGDWDSVFGKVLYDLGPVLIKLDQLPGLDVEDPAGPSLGSSAKPYGLDLG